MNSIYEIIYDSNAQDLAKSVSEYLKAGWKIAGSLVFADGVFYQPIWISVEEIVHE